MRGLVLALAALSAANDTPGAEYTLHRPHVDPDLTIPRLDSAHGQSYHPHPHWHGRTHRAWKRWVRAGKPGKGPGGGL